MNSDLNYAVRENDADPSIHTPRVDFAGQPDPGSIDAHVRVKEISFLLVSARRLCATLRRTGQEHAREHRRRTGAVCDSYMTLNQSVYVPPQTQGPLFA